MGKKQHDTGSGTLEKGAGSPGVGFLRGMSWGHHSRAATGRSAILMRMGESPRAWERQQERLQDLKHACVYCTLRAAVSLAGMGTTEFWSP